MYEYSEILTVKIAKRFKFKLFQNYPNPFNPVTNIKFEIPSSQNVLIRIYNLNGKEIKTLINEYKEPGLYEIKWDGTNDYGQKVSSGVYIYSLETGKFSKSLKMLYLK